ncbi:hypothetical protein KPL54_21895 [Clostridium estertheticum]|nr:hypothetical protein [Clostridium estertheticum]
MVNKVKLFIKLFLGLFLYAVGEVMTINANLGLAPWDVFHQGLAKTFCITIGQATIIISIVIVILNSILGERIGWGTLSNMLLIGFFMDFLMKNHLIPVFNNILIRIIMMMFGMLVLGIASLIYLGVGLGSGPRDGLMIVLTKKTKKSVRIVRTFIEVSVLIIGVMIGGSIGIGTVIMACLIGFFVQLIFKIFKFDIEKIHHKFVGKDINFIHQQE